jgi:hypothetical protein
MEINNRYRSNEIGLVASAAAKAQGSYKPLIANEDAPGGKYANRAAIIAATKESLSINNLCSYQYTELLDEGAGAILLNTVLAHESGQWLSSCWRIVITGNERETSNRIEGFCRTQLAMVLGIAPSKNDPFAFDDNFEELAEQKLISEIRKPSQPKKVELDRNDTINNDQYQELLIELEGFEAIAKDILEVYNISTIQDLPRSEYHPAMAKIRKIKRIQEEYEKRSKNG